MKLVIARYGNNIGGPVGSAVIDMDKEIIHYTTGEADIVYGAKGILDVYDENEGKKLKEELAKMYDYFKDCGFVSNSKFDKEIDIVEMLRNALNTDISKRKTEVKSKYELADFVMLEQDGNFDTIFAQGKNNNIHLMNKAADEILKILIMLVR